jgi:hypothetical protein
VSSHQGMLDDLREPTHGLRKAQAILEFSEPATYTMRAASAVLTKGASPRGVRPDNVPYAAARGE